jgi:hypothetical protein
MLSAGWMVWGLRAVERRYGKMKDSETTPEVLVC